MTDYPIGYEKIKTVALLTNPSAGLSSARHQMERARKRLGQLGVKVVAFTGMTVEDNRSLIRQALADDQFDALVVCGGDGMISVSLQEIAESGVPLGIIPAGTGNDHAREYRLPFNPEQAAEVIAEGFVTTVDLGKITRADGQSRWFGTVACAGADAAASRRAEAMNWPSGPRRFVLAFAQEMLSGPFNRFHIEMEGVTPVPNLTDEGRSSQIALDGKIKDDGTLVINRELLIAAFANTRFYGGGVVCAPRADHHDGLLDVCFVGRAPLSEYARYFKAFKTGNHFNVPIVSSYRVKKATISCVTTDDPVYADGEPMLDMPVTVEAVPHAGRFIVPAP